MSTTPTPIDYSTADEIVARPARWYRMARFIMVLAMLGFAPFFAYDGWVNYPQKNVEAQKVGAAPPYNDLNVAFQKVAAVALPIVAIVLLSWTLYNSRGQYRMKGDVVSMPGHPDVPLDAIRAIDETKWDRKGIAYLEYELPSGQKGRSRLDDFIYERPPTDAIYDRIKEKLLPETASGVEDDSGAPPTSEA